TDQSLQDRKYRGEVRSLPVRYFDHPDLLVAPDGRRLQRRITDSLERRCPMQWSCDVGRLPFDEDAIAIDPPPLDVIDVVVYDEAIDGMHQLPVPDVGKEVGLHDGKLHCSLSPAPHATYARRRWKLFRPTTLQIDSTSALLSPTYRGRKSNRAGTVSG